MSVPSACDRPLQAVEAFEPLVADAGEERSEGGDLVHDLGGMRVVPVAAHAVGDELDDLPVGLRFAEGFERFVDALDAALGAGEGSVLFERGGGRKNEVGVAAGLGEVDVLHDEEVELGERGGDVVGVGVRGDGVFALDVHRLERAFEDGIDHLVIVFAGAGRKGDSPVGFELGADVLVVDLLVAGEDVGHGAEVAGALHVVVSAQRVGSGVGAHVVAGEQEQIRERGGGVRATACAG